MDNYKLNDCRFGTHRLIAEEIEENGAVLDVGCNKGYLKTFCKDGVFYGIDQGEENISEAKKNGYAEVFDLDLNNFDLLKINRKFTTIVFGDILEHLSYPEKVLAYFVDNFLSDGGKVIVSLPNVANISVRINLLFGRFDYADSGILDRTHLHLYTLKTGRELIAKGGLKIIKEKYSSDNFGGIIRWLPCLGKSLGYNLIFVCKIPKSQRGNQGFDLK